MAQVTQKVYRHTVRVQGCCYESQGQPGIELRGGCEGQQESLLQVNQHQK